MLQHITIEIQDANQFAAILRGALDRELHLVEYAIIRTWDRLREFEQKYNMSTSDLQRRFTADDLGETLDYTEHGHKLRFCPTRSGTRKPQFVTAQGIHRMERRI